MHKHYWTVITVLALSGMVSCSSGDQKVNNEPQCVDDDKRCNQETPQKCIGGTWVDQETCDENNKCNKGDCIENHPSATTTNTCEGNGLRCSYSGVPQKCVDDQWVDQDSCTSDEKCVNRETGENTLDFCARLFYDVACARGAAAESVRDYRPSLPDPANTGVGKRFDHDDILTQRASGGGSFLAARPFHSKECFFYGSKRGYSVPSRRRG